MPDSSPLEELTAGETNSGHIGYQCQGRQPLQEAEAILADQLREVRQLFQPTSLTAYDQRVVQPPNTWPRGQQVQPQQQLQPLHQLLQYLPMGDIAPELPQNHFIGC